ncbi:alpha/beta fold hydrolase [Novosphingobium sp. fls2-241-R2A-195]|jgi:NADPH:quinone reductase-like Zn-dependent oxidoreductase/pimeloyl-ACP methyl ester carboxylesterase|uniref:alpha/beta fold hydrolase n=1 Tax=Novosphingobium sp. fls2-241-R2A-195 TaxID=3040296 RepID=UPI00254EA51E|nr:alpha/beta fold hydrolase [Novosphingobium sp. fls2-241-R2A-195]
MAGQTKGYARTGAGQIHFRSVDGPGIPLVLLHRTPVSSSSFDAMLDYLDGRNAAVALDTPGFGQSFRPDGSPSTEEYGRWLLEALDALGIGRLHLAAHHTGTHFAAEMARLAPERAQSLTLSGVLYAPEEDRAKMRADIGNAAPIASDGSHVSNCWDLMKSLFLDYDGPLVHAETLGALTAMEARDQAFDAIFAQDFGAVFREVRCPVQIVQAADDPLTLGGMLTRFREDFPAVSFYPTGPAFLATPERQAGQFARALLDFIQPPYATDKTMANKRYTLKQGDTGYDLVRADAQVPSPAHGEVVVRVHAVSINRRDVSIRDLSYPVNGADNFTPLSDAAGEIVALGAGVERWQVGDRVASTFCQNWADGRLTLPAAVSSLGGGGPGVFADYVVLSASGITRIPEGWSWEEAAALPCAGVTAWRALMTLGKLEKDDWVLIIGTGGVALFALQIAVAAGAKAIVLSSSDEKIETVKAMGAHSGVNYVTTPEWADAVRAITGGAGVNQVVELGGSGTIGKSIASLGLDGHLALIGALDGFGGDIPAMPMIFAALRVSAVLVGSRADQEALVAFMEDNSLRPVIDRVFPFEEAEAAYTRTASGAFGKVIVSLNDAA